jgi:hypothetical protein
MKVLILNHSDKNCGIHQYGVDIFEALRHSKFEFRYAEVTGKEQILYNIGYFKADIVIFNYYPITMPYVDIGFMAHIRTIWKDIVTMGIMHEVTQESADGATNALFDYWLCPDPTLVTPNLICLSTKRLIPNYYNFESTPKIPTIGTFGFGFKDKGFDKVVTKTCEEFDKAIINIHIPNHFLVGDSFLSSNSCFWMKRRCKNALKKSDVTLNFTHEFLTKTQLLHFLSDNTINCFFYDTNKNKGISSVIDSALAVSRPIALTKCGMFRHITDPRVYIEDNTLKEIIKRGYKILAPLQREWRERSFISDYERILEDVLSSDISSKRR